MTAGSGGTFVVSWLQTEIDGVASPGAGALAVGASWRWSGTAVRVDGPQDLLNLGDALGQDELRRRAGRVVRRLVGAAFGVGSMMAMPEAVPEDEACFVVTDGLKAYHAGLIDIWQSATRLIYFAGGLPPADRDLWIVRVSIPSRPARQPNDAGVICFTPGTRLQTPSGPCPIETLRPGDLVSTKDNGPQPVLWIGRRHMSGARLHAMPHLRPIRIRSSSFGTGQPDEDLLVSPRHRMLIRGPVAWSLFNTDEVLIAAADLRNDLTITVDYRLREVTYVHVLLEQHQIVWANGLETESFHPAHAALDEMDPGQRNGLLAVLPALAAGPDTYGAPARRPLTAPEAAILRYGLAE
jgi:hypothetical protein